MKKQELIEALKLIIGELKVESDREKHIDIIHKVDILLDGLPDLKRIGSATREANDLREAVSFIDPIMYVEETISIFEEVDEW